MEDEPPFLSTLPARGATCQPSHVLPAPLISIHAPREGSDKGRALRAARKLHFYPRSPRGERRHHHRRDLPRYKHFYPRSPRGERPWTWSAPAARTTDFYPRSPRGERLGEDIDNCPANIFLSTLPARGATVRFRQIITVCVFLSTLPARGATYCFVAAAHDILFLSTLPARGATLIPCEHAIDSSQFLSTLPARGATHEAIFFPVPIQKFLSTLPARGATLRRDGLSERHRISIHAPREGSDGSCPRICCIKLYFYPRSPRGERL